MKTINFIHSGKIYECCGDYFHKFPDRWNQFSKHFNMNVFTFLEPVNDINKTTHQKLDDQINFYNFYQKPSPSRISIFSNWNEYKSKLEQHCDLNDDIFFIWYPGRRISMAFAYLLRNYNLVIWVNSLYKNLFDLEESLTTRAGKKILKPFFFPIYNHFTKTTFEDNLVFYTGEVTFDEDNHINQVAITCASRFNQREDLIKTEFTNKVIYIGRDTYLKRLSDAIEFIDTTNKDLQLTIMGVENKQLSKKDNISVVGEIYEHKQFYDILSEHDILLFPSIREKQGQVQLEAMSAGVVPVCADSGGKHTTIKNYYNGLLYKPKSIEDLNRCVEFLYDNPETYLNIQNNGIKYVSKLSVEEQVQMMADTIKNYYAHNDSNIG